MHCAGESRAGRNGCRDLGLVPRAEVGVRHAIAVGERPAVEPARHDPVQLVGREVVTEQVTAIVGRVQLVGARAPVEADRVAQAGRVQLLAAAVEAVADHGRAPGIFLDARVAARSHGYVEPAVGSDTHRTRPVVAAGRKAGDDARERAARRARLCVEADPPDGTRLRHPQPAIMDVEPMWTIESAQEDGAPVGFPIAVAVAPEKRHLSLPRLTDEEVARRREAQEAGVRQVARPRLPENPSGIFKRRRRTSGDATGTPPPQMRFRMGALMA
jgi:hypothetical protein